MSRAELRMKILFVEDEPKMARVLQRGLSEEGHQVDLCARGADALKQAQEVTYDVIISDYQMPGMNGIEATAEIRKREEASGRHIPTENSIGLLTRMRIREIPIAIPTMTPMMIMAWASSAPSSMYHLETNPPTGGAPIMLSDASANAPNVNGITRPRPLISEMFFLCVAT